MATLESIRERCVIDEETGCWVWSGAVSRRAKNGGAIPVAWHDGRVSSVLRVVYAAGGRDLGREHIVWRVCGCEQCVRPGHLMAGTRAEWGRWRVESGQSAPSAEWCAANLAQVRRRHSENGGGSLELAAYVRQSASSGRALAAELGVSPSSISRWRRGASWAETVSGASVFSWRP